jgi:O-antigen ligase
MIGPTGGDGGERAARALAWLGVAGVAALTVVLYLGDDWPWPAASMLRAGVVASSAATIAWLLARPRPAPGVAAYGLYAGALAVCWIAAPGPEASNEIARQAAFLAVVAAAAAPFTPGPGARARAWLFALHVVALLLVFVQLAGPRSAFDHLGRAGFYHALEQWSGYPELGLLMAAASCGLIGLAIAARPIAVRLAAAALALGFALATVFLQSRSAVLTVPIVALWLLGVAAVRWRSKVAAAGLAAAVVLMIVVAVRGGGVSAIAARLSESVARETAIREQGWTAARAMAAEHPITGVGLGRYRREYLARRIGDDPSHAYNIVLHVLAEGGAIGLLGWLALWLRVLWAGVRGAGPTPRGAMLFALHGMLVAFLVRSQSEHFLANLATSDRMLLLLALWMGCTEGFALDAARERGQPARPAPAA